MIFILFITYEKKTFVRLVVPVAEIALEKMHIKFSMLFKNIKLMAKELIPAWKMPFACDKLKNDGKLRVSAFLMWIYNMGWFGCHIYKLLPGQPQKQNAMVIWESDFCNGNLKASCHA